jgi:signal transduction histidine kinase
VVEEAVQCDMGSNHPQRGSLLAWSLWIVCVAGAAASLVLAVLNRAAWRETSLVEAGGNAGLAVIFGTVGVLVANRHCRNPVGWLLIALGGVFAFQGVAQEYTIHAFVVRPGALSGGEIVAWLNTLKGEVTVIGLAALLLLFFPDGRLPGPAWRVIAWMAIGGMGLSMLAAFRPGPFRSATYLPPITNPLGVPGGDLIFGVAETIGMVLMLLASLLAVAATVSRYRRAKGSERRQLAWLVLGIVAIIAFMLGTQALFTLPQTVEEPLFYLAFAILPVAIGIAILKHDLYDIHVVLNRTLVWGSLTAFVVGTYVAAVTLLGAIFQARGELFPSLIATGLVALLFQPLRYRLQRVVNRFVYGDRDDPYAVVSRLGKRLETTLAPETVLPTIVETVAESLKLPYVAVSLGRGASMRMAAAVGTPGGDHLTVPLVYQSKPIGQLSLAPRIPGDRFTEGDLRLLEDLARQVGIAAHAVQLTDEVQRARERLVTAREEERRRLRRDLHDGIGPSLGSISLKLDAARNLLPRDPEAVEALLAELSAQTQAAIGDIRRAVYDLRPPALDDLGLVPALQAHAARMEGSGMHIEVDVTHELSPLPAAVEVAAYRIALEGLMNAARHAGARTCRVGIEQVDAGLVVEVSDDGCGIPEDTPPGVGMMAMRERTMELGGVFHVTSAPGAGCRITATLPLPPPADEPPTPREGE